MKLISSLLAAYAIDKNYDENKNQLVMVHCPHYHRKKYNPHWEARYMGIETGPGAGMRRIKGLTGTK